MTYNPKTHLLRPLEPGEVIEDGDITCGNADRLLDETSNANFGVTFNPLEHYPHFRPVLISATGWRPRSEAREALNGLDGSTIVMLQFVAGQTSSIASGALQNPRWHAFYIIPPCGILPPDPDPERERFEKWAKDSAISTKMEDGKYTGTFTAVAWSAWQAAARKEAA